MIEFIFRCRERLEELRFSPDDALHRATENAYSAPDELRATLHRQSRRGPGS
jgi:hypothetical protein